jgi:hypothetical protein
VFAAVGGIRPVVDVGSGLDEGGVSLDAAGADAAGVAKLDAAESFRAAAAAAAHLQVVAVADDPGGRRPPRASSGRRKVTSSSSGSPIRVSSSGVQVVMVSCLAVGPVGAWPVSWAVLAGYRCLA